MKTIKISPSEIAFLWDRCPRCWYRKVNGLQKPKEALPQMFRLVDQSMKLAVPAMCEAFEIPIKATCAFEKVLSAPIPFDEHGVQIVISGKVDKATEFDDNTFGLVELKMAEASQANIAKYRPQCHAYELALRNPASGDPREISRADMFFLQPTADLVKCRKVDSRTIFSFTGEVHHVPVEIDRAWFETTILEEMARVAGSLELPAPGEFCDYCASLNATVHYDSNLARIADKSKAAVA